MLLVNVIEYVKGRFADVRIRMLQRVLQHLLDILVWVLSAAQLSVIQIALPILCSIQQKLQPLPDLLVDLNSFRVQK